VSPTPLNLCTTCDEDFASLRAFDRHTVSAPSDPIFNCKQPSELQAEGLDTGRAGPRPRGRETPLSDEPRPMASPFRIARAMLCPHTPPLLPFSFYTTARR
jgi:hypothetical protein